MAEDIRQAPAGGPALLRFLPLGCALVILVAVMASGVWRHLSLDEVRLQRTALKGFAARHPLECVCLYIALYCAVVALSIPGALVMTLSGGFVFGALLGGAAAVAGVSSGACVMFFMARTAFGGALFKGAAAGGLARRMAEGVRRHAFSCILFLRLMPAAPIWMVNVLASLVDTPFWVYALATVIGVAPSTFLYASIGANLDAVFAAGGRPSLGMLMRPGVVLPLALLCLISLAPLVLTRRRGPR